MRNTNTSQRENVDKSSRSYNDRLSICSPVDQLLTTDLALTNQRDTVQQSLEPACFLANRMRFELTRAEQLVNAWEEVDGKLTSFRFALSSKGLWPADG